MTHDQLAEHASAIVEAKVDAIICGGDPPVRAAQQATKEIPILGIAEDMVGSRFVASLAKPGGNTTGVSLLSSELDGKRQEILMEAVPERGATPRWLMSTAPRRSGCRPCRTQRAHMGPNFRSAATSRQSLWACASSSAIGPA